MISLKSGDLFERTHAKWLNQFLPSYEGIWGAFIGNDGGNNALPLDGLDKDQEARRGRFSQAHYSLAITVYRLYALRNSDLEDSFPPKPSLAQYLVGHERLFLFMAYVGHVRDMFLQMESALGMKDASLSKAFAGFYAQRSHAIHGPQIPTAVDELSWLIPTIAKENEHVDEWHKNAIWKAMTARGVIYIVDFIRNTCDELFRLISEVHPRVFSAADHFFSGRRVKDSAINIEFNSVDSTDIFMTVGSSDTSIPSGSSTLKIPLNPSGKRDL